MHKSLMVLDQNHMVLGLSKKGEDKVTCGRKNFTEQ